MSERTGLGLTELAVLEAIETVTGGRPRAFRKCSAVLGEIERRIGLGSRYGYDVLLDLARPWTTPVRLVDGQGNFGEPGDDSPAAGPAYTECRLSHAGRVALQAERHQLAPVPLGLINGTRYRSTARPPWDALEPVQPPLDPFRVLTALDTLVKSPDVSDAEILALVGPPDFLTDCEISGDPAALAAGRPVTLQLTGRVTIADERHLIIESLPPDVGAWAALQVIISHANRSSWADSHPELHRATHLPIADAQDLSARGELRLQITLRPGADPETMRADLRGLEGVAVQVRAKFPAPLARMLRSWVDGYRDEDIATSLAALGSAIGQDRAVG
jgi:DNA gyrase/topoisomerase IV subunit A